jgi:hypothetical protein
MQAAGTDTRVVQRIYLSWRTGDGASRRIVGEFWRTDDRVDFKYLLNHKDIFDAVGEGFLGYPDLPFSAATYRNVLPIIARRLVDSDRSDRVKYLEQWNANDQGIDDFDRLALTQAWLTNDRFEFLGEFKPRDGLDFVTDLAGQSHLQLQPGVAQPAEALRFEVEVKPEFEYPVVHVLNSNGTCLGRIKQVHNRLFSHPDIARFDVSLKLKDAEQNGVLKKLFVEVKLNAK